MDVDMKLSSSLSPSWLYHDENEITYSKCEDFLKENVCIFFAENYTLLVFFLIIQPRIERSIPSEEMMLIIKNEIFSDSCWSHFKNYESQPCDEWQFENMMQSYDVAVEEDAITDNYYFHYKVRLWEDIIRHEYYKHTMIDAVFKLSDFLKEKVCIFKEKL